MLPLVPVKARDGGQVHEPCRVLDWGCPYPTNAHPAVYFNANPLPLERKAGWGALAHHRAFQDGETPVLAWWDPKTLLASAVRAGGVPAGKGQEQPQPLVCESWGFSPAVKTAPQIKAEAFAGPLKQG